MGNRNCAVQGCNALEFRDTGICNRHRGEGIEPWWPAEEEIRIKRELENERSGGSTLGRGVSFVAAAGVRAGGNEVVGGFFGEILLRLLLYAIGYGLAAMFIISLFDPSNY